MRKLRHVLAAAALVLLASCGRPPKSSGPQKRTFSTKALALDAAYECAYVNSGYVVATSGTPSMEPLIHGPSFVVCRDTGWDSVRLFDVVEYWGRPDANSLRKTLLLHRAVMQDQEGWIMSGDNNAFSESWDRMVPDTYVGTAVAVFSYTK